MTAMIKDIGDRLNALREEWLKVDYKMNNMEYQNFDLGVKFIMAAAMVELVRIGREEQEANQNNQLL